MATTKIWQVTGRLDKVMRYAANPAKTLDGGFEEAARFHQLGNVLQYSADEMKTEEQFFVTGINCSSDPQKATKEFIETKNTWGKTDGVICFHGYQSFARGEVSPELAHRVGVEFARALWGDRFEVLVTTHLNTQTVHNHFVLNSVSISDGKRYDNCHADYRLLRKVSDEICHKYQLSVIELPGNQKENFAVRKMREEGRGSQRDLIRKDIDAVLEHCSTFSSFCDEIQNRGYLLEHRGSFLRIRPDEGNKFFRLNRLGDGYTEDDIKKRLSENYIANRLAAYSRTKPKRKKAKGFYALYLHYMYLLGGFQKYEPVTKEVYAVLREDSLKLRRYSDEAKLLGEHGIDTDEDLKQYVILLNKELNKLCKDRSRLINKLRHMHDSIEMKPIKEERTFLSKEITRIRKELKLCADIAEHSGVIEQITDYIEEYSEKNMDKEKEGKEIDSR